jgi:hypothetical protein
MEHHERPAVLCGQLDRAVVAVYVPQADRFLVEPPRGGEVGHGQGDRA